MQEKEKSAGKGQKKNWFQGLQSEFKKIVWVDNATLVKQTIAVTDHYGCTCCDYQCI